MGSCVQIRKPSLPPSRKPALSIPVLPKLAIGPVGDAFEQEADRVADAVTRESSHAASRAITQSNTAPAVRRCSCDKGNAGECEECKSQTKVIQRASTGWFFSGMTAPSSVHNVLRSPGTSLDSGTRGFMERRFGYDFSRIRIHTDSEAAESAHSIDALAYTAGHNIVFAAGQYSPATLAGRHLLAHELTHVVQQGDRQDSTLIRRSVRFQHRHFTPPAGEDPIPKALRGLGSLAETTPTINGTELPKRINTPTGWESARNMVRQALTPPGNGFRSILTPASAPPAGASPTPAPGGSPIAAPRTPARTTSPSPAPPTNAGSGTAAPAPNAPASLPAHPDTTPMQGGSNTPAQQTPAPPTACAFQDFDITISVNMMLPTQPTNGKWTETVTPSALGGHPPSNCSSRSHIDVEMTGDPSTTEVYNWLMANEEEHVTDLHDAAVNNLSPYFGWLLALRGSGADDTACHTDLTNKLNQPEANGNTKTQNTADAFLRDVGARVATHDPTDLHTLAYRTRVEPDCSKMYMVGKRKIPARR